jgi:predicted dehydrogenase
MERRYTFIERNEFMSKIAIVGLGYWGPNLVRNFLKVLKKEDIVLCDSNKDQISRVCSQYNINNFQYDYREILNDGDIDSVVICTPAETHFKLAHEALMSNKNVLLEKPMTIASSESEELINIAKSRNLSLMVDLTYLYNSSVINLKKLINSFDFGKINYIDSIRVGLGIFRKDVNVLWDLACHDISIINFLMDKHPLHVRAIGRDYVGTGKTDTSYICLEYDDRAIANIHVSWTSPIKIRQMMLSSDRQSILWDDTKTDEKIKIYNKNIVISGEDIRCRTGEVCVSNVENIEALYLLAKDFINSTKKKEKSFANAESAWNVIKILEIANNSISENGQVI